MATRNDPKQGYRNHLRHVGMDPLPRMATIAKAWNALGVGTYPDALARDTEIRAKIAELGTSKPKNEHAEQDRNQAVELLAALWWTLTRQLVTANGNDLEYRSNEYWKAVKRNLSPNAPKDIRNAALTSAGGMLKKVAVVGSGPNGRLTPEDTDALVDTIRNHPKLDSLSQQWDMPSVARAEEPKSTYKTKAKKKARRGKAA